MDPVIDWQTSCIRIKDRGDYLLKTGKWADCHFLVGTEPNQHLFPGHKLMLAMASPVFDAMFNGGLPEKNDPIKILDVQPDAFRALLEYIYTDSISINSMDKACELCYVAKKYMLPHVVEECTKFLWADLNATNVCRAYEFANLFEESRLAERCLQIICTQTEEMLAYPGFDEVELSTLLTILSQEYLQISSELDLFKALTRYAEKHNYGKLLSKDEENNASNNAAQPNDRASVHPEMGGGDIAPAAVLSPLHAPPDDMNADAPVYPPIGEPAEPPVIRNEPHPPSFRDAVKKIRFLTLTPKQFAENAARSNILSQAEAFAILMNISSPMHNVCPMPVGFSVSTKSRAYMDTTHGCGGGGGGGGSIIGNSIIGNGIIGNNIIGTNINGNTNIGNSNNSTMIGIAGTSNSGNNANVSTSQRSMGILKFYCVRSLREKIDYFNTSVSDCSLMFKVNTSICITGIQVPTQVLAEQTMHRDAIVPEHYSELLYAHLLDSQGARLTYTHCTTRVRYDSLLEISFDRPIFIQRHKLYKIGVAFNKVGWYPLCATVSSMTCENVFFHFNAGPANESVRDGLIRAVVFTHARDQMYNNNDAM